MASPSVRRDLKALRNLINQADLSLALVPEHPSIASARESLNAALGRCDALVHDYNVCRIHESLRVTPAMVSSITDHQWSVAELLA